MKTPNYASQLRGYNKKYQQDTISILKTDFKLMINKDSDPIPSLYKLFFRSMALIHIALEDTAIELKTENDEQHNKYVYHLSSDDQQKNINILNIVKLQKKILDFAVSYAEGLDQKNDNILPKKSEFRSLKPIQILESFHPDTQIYINKGRAKSVRKLGLTSYSEMIKYSKDIEIQGKDRINNNDTHFDKNHLISNFLKCHHNFRKTMHDLNAIDPQNSLLKHFRIILESHSYRVRYIDSTNNENTSNICNGVILLNSPVTAIEPNKPARKQRNDTKINLPVYLTKVLASLPVYLTKVLASGSFADDNIHFCLSDVEDLAIKDKLMNVLR